jgi:Zn-dependent protease
MAAIARVGAWVNLFNLAPIWQLDGGRGFRSLTRSQRWLAAATIAAMWFLTGEGLLLLLLILAIVRTFERPTASEPDWPGLLQYVMLVGALTALSILPVPMD